MKKYFKISVALFMLAGLASCTSDEIIEQQQMDNFTVEAIMDATESRTNPEAYVNSEGKTKYHTNWHSEDAIYVFGKKVKGTLTLQSGAGDTNGKFSGRIYGDSRKLQYSAYPAELVEVDADGFVTGFNLTEIDFKNTMAPMFGEFDGPNTVKFRHLAGMVRVKIDNVPANSTFELKGYGISGKATLVDNQDGTYSLEPEVKNQYTSIKVTNIPAGNQTLYIPVFIANPDQQGIDEKYLSLNLNNENLVGNSPCVMTQVGNITTKNMPDLVWNENAPAKSKLTRVSTLDQNTQPEEVEENTDATKDYDYLITSAEELLWFANEVNTGSNDFEGKVVKLGASIDLGGQKWNPIDGGDKMFKGIFDGDNFMISNLTVSTEANASAGFFAKARGTVKNLYVENVDIQGHYKAGAIVGDGLCSKIENCHVNGGTIISTPYNKDDANNVGGIVGYLSAEQTAYVKDCSVNSLTITAYRKVAGIVGAANGNKGIPEVSGNTVTNTTIIADQTSEYKSKEAPNAGKIVGWNGLNIDLSSNTANNVEIAHLCKNTDDLKNAMEIANTGSTIILEDGVYAGIFEFDYNKTITIKAKNTHKATIDGEFGVAGSGTVNFEGLIFGCGDFSQKMNNQYLEKANNYIIAIYVGNVNVESCIFNTTIENTGAIYQYAANNTRLEIKNSLFNSNGNYTLRTRGNVTVDNCVFDKMVRQCLQVNSNPGFDQYTVFINNTITNPGAGVMGVSIANNYKVEGMIFNVGGNHSKINNISYDQAKSSNILPYLDTHTFTGEVKTIVEESTL